MHFQTEKQSFVGGSKLHCRTSRIREWLRYTEVRYTTIRIPAPPQLHRWSNTGSPHIRTVLSCVWDLARSWARGPESTKDFRREFSCDRRLKPFSNALGPMGISSEPLIDAWFRARKTFRLRMPLLALGVSCSCVWLYPTLCRFLQLLLKSQLTVTNPSCPVGDSSACFVL